MGPINTRSRILLVAPLLVLLTTPMAIAQDAPQPGTVVFSQNKCPYENFDQLNAITDSVLAPVLDELVDEGALLGWGVLTHSWGDEWNWNIYYSAENRRAFFDSWSQFVGRVNERHPGSFGRLVSLCTEHKDNIYSVRIARPQP